MSPKASHRVRPGLSSAASLMTTLLISGDQEVLNQHLNLVTPEYPFFESPWVSARRAFAGSWEYLLEDAIFTAPAHPEWSGAALISREGKLVGIGSLIVNDGRSGD